MSSAQSPQRQSDGVANSSVLPNNAPITQEVDHDSSDSASVSDASDSDLDNASQSSSPSEAAVESQTPQLETHLPQGLRLVKEQGSARLVVEEPADGTLLHGLGSLSIDLGSIAELREPEEVMLKDIVGRVGRHITAFDRMMRSFRKRYGSSALPSKASAEQPKKARKDSEKRGQDEDDYDYDDPFIDDNELFDVYEEPFSENDDEAGPDDDFQSSGSVSKSASGSVSDSSGDMSSDEESLQAEEADENVAHGVTAGDVEAEAARLQSARRQHKEDVMRRMREEMATNPDLLLADDEDLDESTDQSEEEDEQQAKDGDEDGDVSMTDADDVNDADDAESAGIETGQPSSQGPSSAEKKTVMVKRWAEEASSLVSRLLGDSPAEWKSRISEDDYQLLVNVMKSQSATRIFRAAFRSTPVLWAAVEYHVRATMQQREKDALKRKKEEERLERERKAQEKKLAAQQAMQKLQQAQPPVSQLQIQSEVPASQSSQSQSQSQAPSQAPSQSQAASLSQAPARSQALPPAEPRSQVSSQPSVSQPSSQTVGTSAPRRTSQPAGDNRGAKQPPVHRNKADMPQPADAEFEATQSRPPESHQYTDMGPGKLPAADVMSKSERFSIGYFLFPAAPTGSNAVMRGLAEAPGS